MSAPTWRERFAEALQEQRLPETETERLLMELADHQQDLEATSMDAQQQAEALGDPRQLAAEAGRQFRTKRWRPMLCLAVFGLAPVPLVIASGVAALLGLAGLLEVCNLRENPTPIKWMLPWLLPVCTVVAPACVMAWFFARLSVWSGVGQRWRLASLALVCLGAALISCEVRLSDLPGESSITYTLSNPLSWSQWLLPLMLGLGLWKFDEGRLQEQFG